ncbi:MAG: hypothetical protein Sylvanvirus5_22 [Sylvanvirus sp.]|uniref:Uncharacterized protein n=1 Tax=Sylvanvirus sp. TaxID=2487774 RepID=A0A3G5AJ81_9VIRU|nr:MAG: hypothetical protein Sylvanvirus5_22 [Sylvanvirus sp.]
MIIYYFYCRLYLVSPRLIPSSCSASSSFPSSSSLAALSSFA